jgi:signal transduction histidine kinase/CheY-like chemotaxis protein
LAINLTKDINTDLVHAVLRVTSIVCMTTYGAILVGTGLAEPEDGRLIYLGIATLVSSLLFLLWVATSSYGQSWRHWIAMLHDYSAMTIAMALGGAPFMPIYAFALCTVVGHGLRYGREALWGATAILVGSLFVTMSFSEYWQSNVYLGITMIVTTLMLPIYVSILLSRLQTAYRAEQELSLSKSKFLAQASHDLRQPIHAISLFTACLRDAGLARRELEMVDNIDRSLQGVSRLFKSLLDVSTLDSGRVVPKFENIAIADIVEDVVRQNSENGLRNGCEIRIVVCRRRVISDRALLTTILQNIVSNAIKYAAGSTILVGCRRQGGTLALSVVDQGPGIEDSHQARVFDEFYQVRERGDRDIEGVGLGLSIVSRLAKLLSLEVHLASRRGRGTMVTLSGIPVAAAPAPSLGRPPARSTASVEGLQILLVEDDEAVLNATASLLRRWGCEVEAVRAIPTRSIFCDLLITDFDLGGKVTGSDCISEVRRLTDWEVPAVVMSGHDAARVREDIGDQTIPILSKPVRPAELRSVIMAAAMDASDRN